MHTYTGVLFSHIKEEILPFSTAWMDPEGIMLREISQTGNDKYCIISLICEIQKTKKTNKQNPKLLAKEIKLVVTRGRGWEGGGIERKAVKRYKLAATR